MSGSAKAGTNAERHTLRLWILYMLDFARSSVARVRSRFFLLTMTYIEVGQWAGDHIPLPKRCPSHAVRSIWLTAQACGFLKSGRILVRSRCQRESSAKLRLGRIVAVTQFGAHWRLRGYGTRRGDAERRALVLPIGSRAISNAKGTSY